MNSELDADSNGIARLARLYVKHMGKIGLWLALVCLIGVPLYFGVVTAIGFQSKSVAWNDSAIVFWTSMYCFFGAAVILFVVGERLRVMKYQRPLGEPTTEALYAIVCEKDSVVRRKAMAIIFCFDYHVLMTSLASGLGAQLAKRYLAGG